MLIAKNKVSILSSHHSITTSQPPVMSENCCIFCSKSSQSLLQCSGCGSVQYCDQQCQRAHWKNHKRDCKPFRVCEIAGKNKGIVASRALKQGQVILRDQPLLILKKSEIKNKVGEITWALRWIISIIFLSREKF